MIASGLQILSEREDVGTLRGEILHGGEDFVLFFSKTEHQTSFGRNFRMRFLGMAEQFERALIHRALADLPVEARHGFGVVVENIRAHSKNDVQRVPITAKIRNEHFDFAAWNAAANLFDGARKDVRAAIRLIVAVDRSHHRVAQSHFGHSFRHAKRFFFIRWPDGLARRHGAESASACADVPQNHEGRGAVLPALAHVGAARALADRVQIERAHDALQILVALATEKLDAQPIGPGVRARRGHRHRRNVRDDVERCRHWTNRETLILPSSSASYKLPANGLMVLSLFPYRRPFDGRRSENAETYARLQAPRGSWS